MDEEVDARAVRVGSQAGQSVETYVRGGGRAEKGMSTCHIGHKGPRQTQAYDRRRRQAVRPPSLPEPIELLDVALFPAT